jgi:hypothetical protein
MIPAPRKQSDRAGTMPCSPRLPKHDSADWRNLPSILFVAALVLAASTRGYRSPAERLPAWTLREAQSRALGPGGGMRRTAPSRRQRRSDFFGFVNTLTERGHTSLRFGRTWRFSMKASYHSRRCRHFVPSDLLGRRFGYRRLELLLARQGVRINHKKLYRLYKEERLSVRKRGGRKRALCTRAPMAIPQDRNLRWSLDFVMDTSVTGASASSPWSTTSPGNAWTWSWIPRSPVHGSYVISTALESRGYPRMIVSDNGTEFTSKRHIGLAGGAWDRMALHRSRQADAEWLRRELQQVAG